MKNERLNDASIGEGDGFDSEQAEAQHDRNQRFGRKILEMIPGALRGLFVKKEKPHSSNYLLSENVEVYGRTKKDQKWWKETYENWDKCGIDVPYELGKMVEGVVNNPDYVFGVHHSNAVDGANYQNDEVLESIMENGLINMGDASSGRIYKNPPVHKTVSMCPDMFQAVIQMKGSYKGSTGAVLVAIPSKYVKKSGEIIPGMEDEIYYTNKIGNSVLRPEFILGFVQNLGKGSTCKFESREDLLRGYEEQKTSPSEG